MPVVNDDSKAVNVLEEAVTTFVNNKQYDMLLALERQGVSLVHGLAVAAYHGKHEQAEWFLARGVKPNARVLRLAIIKGKEMTARIMPHVKLEPEHADAAAFSMQPDLLGRIIDSGVHPTAWAYKYVGQFGGGRNMDATIDLLMRRGEPWRAGTRAILSVMHLVNAQQVGNALSAAPSRFNREKILARALRCGAQAVAQETASYGFGTKITARVAIRTVGERVKHFQDRGLYSTAMSLVQMHRDTKSEPLNDKVVTRVLRHLVRNYISTFHGDERERGERQAKFLEAYEALLSMGDPANRLEILTDAHLDFIIDRAESKQAQVVIKQQAMWPVAYDGFGRFKGQFDQYLQEEINKAAAASLAADEEPTFGGP